MAMSRWNKVVDVVHVDGKAQFAKVCSALVE